MKKLSKLSIGLLIIGLLMGYIIGYSITYPVALGWCLDKGLYFLELKGIDIEVNKELIVYGLGRYSSHLDNWQNGSGWGVS